MLRRCPGLLVLAVMGIASAGAWAAEPFPPHALPQVIRAWPPDQYEPSDLAWHTGLDRLFVVSDGGLVSSMKADGSSLTNWTVGGDLEGICVANPASNFVYLGVEHPDSIREFNLSTGLVTRTFDLTTWMTGPTNSGLEALTFVPDAANPEGGLFYAGLQSDGRIYKFQLPILSSSTSTTVSYQGTITPVAGRTDISGMGYDADLAALYAIFDTSNTLVAMTADGTLLQEWELPGVDQEGVALHDNALYLAEDTTGKVIRYSPLWQVPEPSTFVILGTGMIGLVGYCWRYGRRRRG